jgi:hypothetical protein
MDPAYEMVGDLRCQVAIDGKTQKTTFKKRDQFGPELSYFSGCILNDIEPEPNGLEGLADVRTIQALLESEKNNRPVEIPAVEKGQWPSSEQEIHKPAVSKPDLVHAAAPSQ